MHGITDNENTWNERSKPNVDKLFDNLITSKATKPFIAVFALGTVNNTTNPYTFSGSGSIAGAGSLTKSGSGALTLATANSYSGYTTLEAGTLNLANPAALGTSLFVVSGGTLNNTSGSALALVNNVQQAWNGDFTFTGTHSLDMGSGLVLVGGDGTDRTITVNANTLVVGEISATSHGLIKQGAGTLEVTSVGVGNNASVVSGGPLNVAAGTLQINRTGSNGDGSGDFTVAGLTGSGTITTPAICAGELRIERLFGPEIKTGPYKHPARIEELKNGDLYVVYYGGEGEYATDTGGFASRLKKSRLRRESESVTFTFSSRGTRSAGAGRKSGITRTRPISPWVYVAGLRCMARVFRHGRACPGHPRLTS